MIQSDIIQELRKTGESIVSLKSLIESSITQLKESQIIHYVLLEQFKKIRGKEFVSILAQELNQTPSQIHRDFISYKKLMDQDIVNAYCLRLMDILK